MNGRIAKGISGSTACFPLIGHPVAQVRSPPVINAFFDEQQIDAVMIPVDLAPSQVAAFFDVVRAWSNCGGVSVTVPHKQAAFACVDEVSERARRIGAVNAVRREAGGRLIGENTDGLAFVAAMRAGGTEIKGARCLVIGAGGAGSAIAHALATAGASAITLADIDAHRREALAASLTRHHPTTHVRQGFERGDDPDIVVNASILGMRSDDGLPFDLGLLNRAAIVADVVTKPVVTAFLADARARGWRTQTGEDMAVAQLEIQAVYFAVDRYRLSGPSGSTPNNRGNDESCRLP
jgi:shikimate dehydrogenase